MTLTLRYAAHSDRGLIRDGNQDSVYAGPRLLAVADGMGGMAAGDVASNIVIGAMAPLDEDVPGDALVDALRHLDHAHRAAVALYYLADLTVAEVAAELGVPEGTVKTRLARSRELLGPMLSGEEADHG